MRFLVACAVFSISLVTAGAIGGGAIGGGSIGAGERAMGEQPGGNAAAGCPAYPSTPVLWIDPAQETAYANNDPYTSISDFGSDGTALATTTDSGSTPTFLDPCESGVASDRPCASFDGGDFIRQAAVNAALKFIHDGTGGTCAWVVEVTAGTTGVSWGNGAWSSTEPGAVTYYNATPNTLVTGVAGSAGLLTGTYEPNSVTIATGTVTTTVLQHATANTPDWATWRNGSATDSGSYLATPSTANPAYELVVGARPSLLTARISQRLYELACWDSGSISVDDIHAVLECKYGGAFPQ